MIKKYLALMSICIVGLSGVGCGDKDINKNLKPISPDALKPIQAAPESGGGASKAPPAIK